MNVITDESIINIIKLIQLVLDINVKLTKSKKYPFMTKDIVLPLIKYFIGR
jgi:hypothetical protein